MCRNILALLPVVCLSAQEKPFDFHFQATTITQTHGPFDAPYSGANSLPPVRETDTSLTTTVFLTLHYKRATLEIDPELAGGTGFAGVVGIAGFPNGEITRVGKPTPTPYLARLYLKQSISRFTWTLGKLAASDFFDNNSFSHDPRTQFENWALMYNGAWDYPADTRGYTIGAIQEVSIGKSVLRAGAFLEPEQANQMHLDRHLAANHSEAFEWQMRYSGGGTIRALAFLNHANIGTYRDAGQDIVATRRSGTLKYGFGINLEQRLTPSIGVFSRWGWNDGKTESWAFAEIDRTVSAGLSMQGSRWRRSADRLGFGVALNGISGDHRAYLARGGYGFLIGDGKLLHFGRENGFEVFYACRVQSAVTITPGIQIIRNPAYNRDRGPVVVATVRFHVER
jgi:high affinity Mn2+ porin